MPEALTSLKYFAKRQMNIILLRWEGFLGVSVNKGKNSFPVDNVQFIDMLPMDFEEYLWAKEEEILIKKIRDCYDSNSPLEAALHEKALALYKEYLFIGGMPAVVSDYIKE